ncbi:MAG: methyltransferase domain-containing protein [Xanthobacteraceae bacterium]|nr:methyltransferase domain-containing protein [Xanthobacteraceae bacterium]
MHPLVFEAFDVICRGRVAPGARVLEVGATASEDTLLRLPALAGAGLRVGVNLDFVSSAPGLDLVRVAADGLAAFPDGVFDVVLCNSVLEHDPRFWRTVAGMRRVARPGALMVVGVPGFADLPATPLLRLAHRLSRLPGAGRLLERITPGWGAATPTLVVHNYPGDYYRFSEQAMRDVLLAGCVGVEMQVVLRPPRIIGFGTTTASSA